MNSTPLRADAPEPGPDDGRLDSGEQAPDPFSSHLPVIESAIAHVVRRHRLSRDEADDFASLVRLRLLENGCAVLRKYEGRASIRTFLIVVIQRLFLDARTSQWGKWRPSAAARRLGPVAIRLETLVARDGLPFSEACAVIHAHDGLARSRAELSALLGRLPRRARRRFVGEAPLEHLPAPSSRPDLGLLRPEAERILSALDRSLARLNPEDRVVIKLRFVERWCLADIARARGLDQKALYRRFDRVLRRLRADLQREGIRAADLHDWLGELDVDHPVAWSMRAAGDAM